MPATSLQKALRLSQATRGSFWTGTGLVHRPAFLKLVISIPTQFSGPSLEMDSYKPRYSSSMIMFISDQAAESCTRSRRLTAKRFGRRLRAQAFLTLMSRLLRSQWPVLPPATEYSLFPLKPLSLLTRRIIRPPLPGTAQHQRQTLLVGTTPRSSFLLPSLLILQVSRSPLRQVRFNSTSKATIKHNKCSLPMKLVTPPRWLRRQ